MPYNPQLWHEDANGAGFLIGVADDHINAALKMSNTPHEICKSLDYADAALCSALKQLTNARAEAAELRQMMEDLDNG